MNEPVAWMVDGVLFNSLGAALNISFDIEQPCIPLYTHPADESFDRTASHMAGEYVSYPAKTLTDEEIVELTNDSSIFEYREFNDDMVRFARAILKKASKK